MPEQPLISIIIPTFNRAHLLGETLDSVLAQTYPNWECIVVDDGSTDATEALLESYIKKDARFLFYKRPDTHLPGGNGARNYGFEKSKGDYVQWFDSDDFMLPQKLELKINAILKHQVDFVVCRNAEIYSLTPYKTRPKWIIQKEGDVLLNHIKGSIAFTTPGPFFKKSFLKKKLLFDENILISQEWEFFSRLLTEKPKVFYMDDILYHFRNIDAGIRGNLTEEKILNKTKTEINLYRYINKTKYFKNTAYLESYNRYKFFTILNRYKYLNKNYGIAISLPYFFKGLRTINISYFLISIYHIIRKPKIVKVLFKGWIKS